MRRGYDASDAEPVVRRGADFIVVRWFTRRSWVFGVALAVAMIPTLLAADQDGGGEDWRREALAACRPTWDPHDPRIHTWNDRTLHGEPFEVRNLFYRVWGDDDLEGGRHLRRWRWEWECLHPRPTIKPRPMPKATPATERECTCWDTKGHAGVESECCLWEPSWSLDDC